MMPCKLSPMLYMLGLETDWWTTLGESVIRSRRIDAGSLESGQATHASLSPLGPVSALAAKVNHAWPRSRPVGAILMYHRVQRAKYDPWRLSISPENFDAHLSVLAREKVVPLRALSHSPGSIAVT